MYAKCTMSRSDSSEDYDHLEFEYSKTSRGKPAVILDGYKYHKNRAFKNTTYWICAENRDHHCNAKVTTKDGRIIKVDDRHKDVPHQRIDSSGSTIRNVIPKKKNNNTEKTSTYIPNGNGLNPVPSLPPLAPPLPPPQIQHHLQPPQYQPQVPQPSNCLPIHIQSTLKSLQEHPPAPIYTMTDRLEFYDEQPFQDVSSYGEMQLPFAPAPEFIDTLCPLSSGMPSKRRKASVAPEVTDDGSQSATPAPKRRKRNGTGYDPGKMCEDLYESLRNHKGEDGRLICESFIRIPKRRSEPEYYDLVSKPIDLMKIQHKIKNEEYEDIDQLSDDVELLVENAKLYYACTTQEHADALALWQLFQQTKSNLLCDLINKADPKQPQLQMAKEEEVEELEELVLPPEEEIDDEEQSKNVRAPEELTFSGAKRGITSEKEEDDDEDDDDDVLENRGQGMSLRVKKPQDFALLSGLTPRRVSKDDQDETGSVRSGKDDDASSVASGAPGDDNQVYEEIFNSVIMAKEGNRFISDIFKILPSKSKYPDYYQLIKDPIDLKKIAQKIQGCTYTSMDELVKDLNLMVANAKLYNEPGSQVYKDALAIKKIVAGKRSEVSGSRRTRSRRPVIAVMKHSAIIASLPNESDDEDTMDENIFHETELQLNEAEGDAVETEDADTEVESTMMEGDLDESVVENDSPQWALYNRVRYFPGPDEKPLAEKFLRLPNKRFYPDYYDEIQKPMSLAKVHKKMKEGRYKTLDALVSDLELVFHNATRYNIEGSLIYKNAQRLQHVLREKAAELEPPMTQEEPTYQATPVIKIHNPMPQSTPIRNPSHHPDLTPQMMPMQSNPAIINTPQPSTPVSTPRSRSTGTGRRRGLSPEEALQRRLWTFFKVVNDHQVENRNLIDIFLVLPSKQEYPDYYQVIANPIDMGMIKSKIEGGKYNNEYEIRGDLLLVFSNAKQYNEQDSQVYKDAVVLEKVLKQKIKNLHPLQPSPARNAPISKSKAATSPMSPLYQQLFQLYHHIRDLTDEQGRVLSAPFMVLPSKQDYPDYYEIIKKPMDMQKISQRWAANQYQSLEDMVSDMVLMFDNACKYNEPESLIYKDALTLQRACFEKKRELAIDNSTGVPDVRATIQELMTNLYIYTINHTDEEGRCLSDSFLELPALHKANMEAQALLTGEQSKLRRTPCFERVKRNVDKGRYRRLDRFQEDMFEVFEYARKVSRSDSQLFEDAADLQFHFIKIRDRLCKNGDTLLSPALSYTDAHHMKALEVEKKEKHIKEMEEDEKKKLEERQEELSVAGGLDGSFIHQGTTYHVGDFVYIEPRDKTGDPHIVAIEKLWKTASGENMIRGAWYLRPNETYHLATRKFLQQEVFKAEVNDTTVSSVLGKCFVMYVKDYFKQRPEGYADKDVFVCESRYNSRQKSFKKIKNWSSVKNEYNKIIDRDLVLVPKRVASVFADKSYDSENDLIDGEPFLLDKKREVVEIENYVGGDPGTHYYEQLEIPGIGWAKLGDNVYVKNEEGGKAFIARVDKLWTDVHGDSYFYGPYYIYPHEVDHQPTRMFYKHEVFKSTIEETNPLSMVEGLCAVLSLKDFCTKRPTEIEEENIYVCESKYIESDRSMKKFKIPYSLLRKNTLSVNVCDNEILFFKAVQPEKVPSPLLMQGAASVTYPGRDTPKMEIDESSQMSNSFTGESFFGGNSSFYTNEDSNTSTPTNDTPTTATKKKGMPKGKGRPASGYIMFAAEFRKKITEQNSELTFGEISRKVGQAWRDLEKDEKEKYEGKAKKIAEEQAAKQEEADKAFNESLKKFPPSPGGAGNDRPQTPGQQQGNQGQPVPHPQQGLNTQAPAGQPQGVVNQQQMGPPPPPPRPASPVFVSVPPRTQRLVHSDAYLRYIENLTVDSTSVGNWEKQLNATPENIKPTGKLPVHWLGNGSGHHENTTDALWALRDLMMRDTLNISRVLDYNEL